MRAAILICVVAALSALPSACGKVKASSVVAQIIPGPGGFTCFAIMDGDRVAGGNCVSAP